MRTGAGTHTPRLLLLEKTGNRDLTRQLRPALVRSCERRGPRPGLSDSIFKQRAAPVVPDRIFLTFPDQTSF